ncbi:MAG: redoxin domain-containing protein, partial [Gaiellales bacterium]
VGVFGVVATQVTDLREGFLDTASDVLAGSEQDYPAPDFTGISAWLNSEPLSLGELRGRVVLIDFWTYSCINCIRTLPHLKDLYARYRSSGLEIVGVHSPEFDFEKDEDNVARAIDEYGVTWPVAMDNEMETWSAYRNNYWPHVYLIDRNGHVRFDYIGEGHDEAIEEDVRELLAMGEGELPAELAGGTDTQGSEPITPEIYLGPERGSTQGFLANDEGYQDGIFDYGEVSAEQIEEAVPAGTFFLTGRWRAAGERLVADEGAGIVLPFLARNVHIVAGLPEEERGHIEAHLDGKPIEEGAAGEEMGASTVVVDGFDLYDLLALGDVEYHVLSLDVERGISVYAFTFGS